MALPQVAFYQWISVQSTLSAFVSDRIFVNKIPQENKTYPAIRYSFISGIHDHDLQGSAGVYRARVQIDCYSEGFLEAIQMAEEVRLLLDGFNGLMDTTKVHWSKLDSDQYFYEPPVNANDKGLHRQSQDYLIRFVVPIPS